MILDTSFLIDLFDGHQEAFEKGLEVSEAGVIQRIPSPVAMELSYGATFGSANERRDVQNALRMYPIVELDEQVARRAGTLLANADKDAGGESGIGAVDSMIGAVAESYGEPVLTANVADFERLGVGVETYR